MHRQFKRVRWIKLPAVVSIIARQVCSVSIQPINLTGIATSHRWPHATGVVIVNRAQKYYWPAWTGPNRFTGQGSNAAAVGNQPCLQPTASVARCLYKRRIGVLPRLNCKERPMFPNNGIESRQVVEGISGTDGADLLGAGSCCIICWKQISSVQSIRVCT